MILTKEEIRALPIKAIKTLKALVDALIRAQERIDALEKELTELKKSIDSGVKLTDENRKLSSNLTVDTHEFAHPVNCSSRRTL